MTDRMNNLIRRARSGEITAARAVSCLSTSEELYVLLGIGTPAAMRILAKTRFPTVPEAWQRLGREWQEELVKMWEEC